MRIKTWVVSAMAGAAMASMAVPAMAQDKLTVWWVKGFYKAEDDALFAAIKKFEEKFNAKVNIDLYDNNEVIEQKLQSGQAPYDIAVPSDPCLRNDGIYPRADRPCGSVDPTTKPVLVTWSGTEPAHCPRRSTWQLRLRCGRGW